MNNLQNISFDKLLTIYNKYFNLGYINQDISDKLALISLTCYVTNELRNKGKNINCYKLLLQIGKDFSKIEQETILKSLGVICESLMYGNKTFPDFGIKPKDMPKTIHNLLKNYCPF